MEAPIAREFLQPEVSMRIPRQALLTLPVALLAAAAMPSEAAAKCLERAGSPVLPGYVLIVDGDRVGEYAMDANPEMPPSEEILVLSVTCVRAAGDENPAARQAATVVVTKKGASRLLNSYLRDLVAAQEEYRSMTGEYTADLARVGFFDSHIEIPIEMEVGRMGWFAAATVPGSNTTCRVAVGTYARDARFGRGALNRSGKPLCRRD